MKIDNNNLRQATLALANQDAKAKTGAEQAAAPEATPAKNDTVSLSDRSRMVARAQELVDQAPEVRADRVEDLRSRIASGTYNVSGQVVADSLLKKLNTLA